MFIYLCIIHLGNYEAGKVNFTQFSWLEQASNRQAQWDQNIYYFQHHKYPNQKSRNQGGEHQKSVRQSVSA